MHKYIDHSNFILSKYIKPKIFCYVTPTFPICPVMLYNYWSMFVELWDIKIKIFLIILIFALTNRIVLLINLCKLIFLLKLCGKSADKHCRRDIEISSYDFINFNIISTAYKFFLIIFFAYIN